MAIRNHPYKDPDALVDLGTTRNGGRILINRTVVEADFKMGIGSIVPHHIPGYAGGAKIIQPGVSGEDTTAYTHLLSVRAPRSYLGVLDNPVREELDAMARKVGMNTILNTVLNRQGEVVQAFFGDVVEAFRAGVAKSREVYEIPVPEEADIVLAGSHPCDLDFWQAHKTLYPSDLAVKAGGIVIVLTPCSEGVSRMHGDILELTSHGSRQIREMVSGKRVRDEVGAALAIAWAQVKEREEVWIVSDGICADEASKLGFRHFTAVQDALDAALAQKGPAARVTVLTQAPDMLPRISAAATLAESPVNVAHKIRSFIAFYEVRIPLWDRHSPERPIVYIVLVEGPVSVAFIGTGHGDNHCLASAIPSALNAFCQLLSTEPCNPIAIRFDEKVIKPPFAVCSAGKFGGMVANSHINITSACGPDSASCILIQSKSYGPVKTNRDKGKHRPGVNSLIRCNRSKWNDRLIERTSGIALSRPEENKSGIFIHILVDFIRMGLEIIDHGFEVHISTGNLSISDHLLHDTLVFPAVMGGITDRFDLSAGHTNFG